MAGPAAAVSISDIKTEVRSVIGGESNIRLRECDGVVTVTGYFGDASDESAALRVIERADGVVKVVNLAFD